MDQYFNIIVNTCSVFDQSSISRLARAKINLFTNPESDIIGCQPKAPNCSEIGETFKHSLMELFNVFAAAVAYFSVYFGPIVQIMYL